MRKLLWTCPNCQEILRKKGDDGENVKRCPKCKASWLLILCRRPVEEDYGQLELFKEHR